MNINIEIMGGREEGKKKDGLREWKGGSQEE